MRRLAALLALLPVAIAVPAAPDAHAVTGGEEADAGEWPWQVALVFGGFVGCGGTLVSLDVVVTAAHCVEDLRPLDIDVVAGTVDIDRGGERRDVVEIVEHEDYDPVASTNDVALLRLSEPYEASDEIAPASLPDAATAAALAGSRDPVVVTGYGSTTEEGEPAGVLLEAEIEVIGDAACTEQYAEDGDEVFGDQQVCAGLDAGEVDACFGDSGGPLVAPADDERTDWYLLGVVSWGAGCGRPLRPTVYAEVAAFTGWLADHGAIGSIDGERFESSGGTLRIPALGSRGKAARYPDAVEVSGVDDDVDPARISVELRGLSHDRPSDLDVWLEAPDGTVVTLLSDVGGDEPVGDVDVVVVADGPAAGRHPLPLRSAPTDLDADAQRKRARPAADLADLAGIDPNGEWRLLVADDRGGASGSLDGWSLVLG